MQERQIDLQHGYVRITETVTPMPPEHWVIFGTLLLKSCRKPPRLFYHVFIRSVQQTSGSDCWVVGLSAEFIPTSEPIYQIGIASRLLLNSRIDTTDVQTFVDAETRVTQGCTEAVQPYVTCGGLLVLQALFVHPKDYRDWAFEIAGRGLVQLTQLDLFSETDLRIQTLFERL